MINSGSDLSSSLVVSYTDDNNDDSYVDAQDSTTLPGQTAAVNIDLLNLVDADVNEISFTAAVADGSPLSVTITKADGTVLVGILKYLIHGTKKITLGPEAIFSMASRN